MRILSFLLGALALNSWSSQIDAGSINDIEHVVLFMQENRAFDHYYGTVSGVRGFNDRAHPPLPNGDNIFYQPYRLLNLSMSYQLPWHVDSLRTSASCMDAPCMSYLCDQGIWNHGRMDAWNTARLPGMGMSHFNRSDLPYYYALIDAFTLGDQYFQATFTETNPNRLHFFTGTNGPSMGHDAVLNNNEPAEGFPWITVAEVLENANISWKLYQEADNFDDNGFAWFANFKNAAAGTPLHDKGMVHISDLEQAFEADLAANTLPQVSWIVAPTILSEHATNHPAAGEDLSARLIARLQAHPEIYAKTAFILNYDEGGQFFDHHWTPTPPISATDGVSSVDTSTEIYNGLGQPLPMGFGFRVPLIIVSPWTRGGNIVSQQFSHTSTIQFLEKRFGITVPTISAWRRAVGGDLTSAFDFDHPDYTWPELPNTVNYKNDSDTQCATLPKPQPPTVQTFPTQEEGVRPSRPLPYQFEVSFSAVDGSANTFKLTIASVLSSGAAFVLYDLNALSSSNPKKYAVGPQSTITDTLTLTSNLYSLSLHGPNGFVRQYSGDATSSCSYTSSYDLTEGSGGVILSLTASQGSKGCQFDIVDNAYGVGGPWQITVNAGEVLTQRVPLSVGNWYDISVSTGKTFESRLMGRVELKGTTTDPAMKNKNSIQAVKPLFPFTHPLQHPPNERIIRPGENTGNIGDLIKASVEEMRQNKDMSRCYNQPESVCIDTLLQDNNIDNKVDSQVNVVAVD